MSNNTPNDQKYTFSELLAQYDKILVPMIQRDYAQGRSDKKATDVRNNLLNDIFSGNEVHFNLVFGSKEERSIDSKEMNCFIPVDGQQRLTTLFLLYLYGQKAGKTNTKLDLSKFSYDTRRAASDFCKSITSEEWAVPNDKNVSDVIKDSSWFMNYWEKDPTVGGMLNMLDAIHGKCKEITVYPNLDNVTFFLFDLESNGLNENLYLKMNSRGKPLTAFENLKAKIEKVLPDTNKVETKWFPENNDAPKNSFKEKWKFFMDRDWTEAFWDSANPEKYDVSITKFIVRFLAGYWAAYGKDKDEEQKIADELKSLNSKDSYTDFIPFEPIKKVLDLENAFPKLAYALTTAPQIAPYWTNDTIKISDKSEYKFLAVIFTYILFDGDESAMRFAWNMAENYVTEYDTFVTYCKRAGEISNFKRDKNCTFYQTLSSIKFIGNTSDQMKEEIAKAQQILNGEQRSDGKTWEEIIIETENYAFFKGAIRFLFRDEKGELSDWNNFNAKWEKAQEYFDKPDNNRDVIKDSKQNKYNLLMSFISKLKYIPDNKCIFDNQEETWKHILTDTNEDYIRAVNDILLGNTIVNESENEEIKRLCKDLKLFKYLTTDFRDSRKRFIHGHWALYPSGSRDGVFLNYKERDVLLHKLDNININNDSFGDFILGWDIWFVYRDKKFQWNSDGNIYLLDPNWNRIPISEESENYEFCLLSTAEMDLNKMANNPKQFTEKLDKLIESCPKEETS